MKKGIISVLSAVTGAAIGAGAIGKASFGKTEKATAMSEKHLALFLLMNQWVKVKQEGKSLSAYLEQNGYKKIGIYGMSYVGTTLVDELKGSSITIAYAIDKNAEDIYADVDIVAPDETLAPVDAIVVTAITYFDEIAEKLAEKVDCPIVSLEDVLYEM